MNHLFYGDNLEVLRRHVEDASVDLVYLDPPFQSGRDYSVLFEARAGERGRARADAFTDTWGWGEEAEEMYVELERLGGATAKVMRALRSILRESDIMAYLCMMAPRLIELRRVLKATGSLYLHCDPTASHYLKILLDNVLGPGCFRNEIIWRYRRWPTTARRFQRMHDVVLFYTARPGTEHTWSSLYGYESLAESTLKTFGTRKQKADFSSGHRKPGVEDKPSEGPPLSDVWDVSIIAPIGKERTGYPTQKPEALLERIIKASSREGDVVLDPFCGSGTTIRVAEKLGRRWIGIDVTHLAIHVAKTRVDTQNCEVVGEPRSLTDVRRLAETAPTQFQWWMLGAIGAQPATKKSADVGFDGELYFKESAREAERTIGVWVRTGKVLPAHVREFVRMMDREGMAMGVLLTLQAPSGATLREAAEAGELASTLGRFPRLQIVTAKDVVAGVAPELPPRRPAAAIAVGAA